MNDERDGPRRTLSQQFARFLILGGLNTAVTSAAFYVLSFWMRPSIAFTIVYACGLAFVTLVTPSVVFGTHASSGRKLALAAWYFAAYLCGLVAIHVLTHSLTASRPVVVVGTLAVTAPLNFIGARWLVGGSADQSTERR